MGGCRLENAGNPQKTNFKQVLDHLSGFENYTFFDFQKKFFSLHPCVDSAITSCFDKLRVNENLIVVAKLILAKKD